MVKTDLEWFGDAALVKLQGAGKEIIRKLALQTEAHVKANIAKPFLHVSGEYRGQIDTGAMLNTTRAVFEGLPAGVDAMVESPQEYAPFQETVRPFLWPGVQQGIADFPSVVAQVKREFSL